MVKTPISTTMESEEKNWAISNGYKVNFLIKKGIEFLKNKDFYNDLERQIKEREDNIAKMQDIVGKAYSVKDEHEETIRKLKKLCIDNNIQYKDIIN